VIGAPGSGRFTLFVRRGSSGQVKANGSFELWRLSPGPLDLRASWEGTGGQREATAPVDIEVGNSNIDNIELRIVPRSDISGQVTFEEEQQAKPAKQESTEGARKPRQIALTGLNGNAGERSVAIGADGAFRMEKVVPGRYRVRIPGGAAYVKSMRLGMTEIDGAVLDLSNGSGGEPLAVTASSTFGAVSGTVSDSQGVVAGIAVALTPENPKGGLLPQLTTTDASGNYTLDSIPPGKYKLVPVEESDIYWTSRGKGLDAYKDTLVEVEVHAKEKLSKDLKRRQGQ
jgi:hypothetical protein